MARLCERRALEVSSSLYIPGHFHSLGVADRFEVSPEESIECVHWEQHDRHSPFRKLADCQRIVAQL
jgi:hypothetical protein